MGERVLRESVEEDGVNISRNSEDAVVAQAVNSIAWAFEGLLETLPDGVKPAHPLEAVYARPKFRWIPIKNEDNCCFRNHVANHPMW